MLGTPSIRRAFSLGITLTAATSLIGACGSDDEQQINLAKLSQGCSLNSNCENPLVCTFEHCHRQCDDDRDCRGEERCVKGTTGHVCQLPADTACTSDRDCNGAQVCGVDKECRDKCTQDTDCTTGQVCAKSGECASTDNGKDNVDGDGNIHPDPFDDTKDGGGAGGSSAGGSSGSGGSGGTGTDGSGGVDGGPDSSVGGTAGTAGTGSGGTAGAGTGGTAGAGTGGTAGSATDGGVDADAGCPTGTGECDGNPNTVCETDFSLSTSCGACTVSCNPQNGTVHCDAAAGYKCVVDSCTAGYDNCDSDGSNGCEARLSDNPNHCGRCGNSCGGGSCTTSNCGAATVMDPPGSSYLYDVELTGNRIVASVYVGTTYEIRTATLPPTTPPSEGTLLHTFASGSERKDDTFVTDATHVYWSTAGAPYTVYRKPLDNPSANIQNMFIAPASGTIVKLEATATAFYYFGSGAAGYGFFTASKTPGTSAQAISGLTGLYSGIGGFAVGGNRLFWASYSSVADTLDHFATAPAAGGAPAYVQKLLGSYSYIGVTTDATHAYWTTYAQNGSIRRVAIATPTVAEDVALSVSYPKVGMVVDATYVYFMDNSNVVYRSKKDGTEAKQRIASPTGAQYLTGLVAYDADFLYGPGVTSGTVARISKNP